MCLKNCRRWVSNTDAGNNALGLIGLRPDGLKVKSVRAVTVVSRAAIAWHCMAMSTLGTNMTEGKDVRLNRALGGLVPMLLDLRL